VLCYRKAKSRSPQNLNSSFSSFRPAVCSRRDVHILDNLNVHKSPRVAEILAKKNGSVRYLPPYSPDFNPIENAYSKLKSALRELAVRTVAALDRCTDLFKPQECQNYFAVCGYDST
jgi:transposase